MLATSSDVLQKKFCPLGLKETLAILAFFMLWQPLMVQETLNGWDSQYEAIPSQLIFPPMLF